MLMSDGCTYLLLGSIIAMGEGQRSWPGVSSQRSGLIGKRDRDRLDIPGLAVSTSYF
jgi:hypothetical protein